MEWETERGIDHRLRVNERLMLSLHYTGINNTTNGWPSDPFTDNTSEVESEVGRRWEQFEALIPSRITTQGENKRQNGKEGTNIARL